MDGNLSQGPIPPPYTLPGYLTPAAVSIANSDPNEASVAGIAKLDGTLPIVIPQTSRSLRGVYFSPFLRAYPETLSRVGISKAAFIRIIDDLNEAFISSPFFDAVMLASTAVSFVPDPTAHIVGGAIATASTFVGMANSHVRTRHFVQTANKKIFEPRGLQLRLLSTDKMLEVIHVDKEKFELPPLPELNEPETGQEHEDPRRRWMDALEDVVAPLDYNAPDFTEQDNWLKKAGAWTAKHKDKRQGRNLTKRRVEAKKKIDAAREKATETEVLVAGTIEQLEADMEALRQQTTEDAKAELSRQRMMAECESAIYLEQVKLVDERVKEQKAKEKAIAKVDKKEQKVVQKIRWVVITPSTTGDISDADVDDGVEDVRPLRNWGLRG